MGIQMKKFLNKFIVFMLPLLCTVGVMFFVLYVSGELISYEKLADIHRKKMLYLD